MIAPAKNSAIIELCAKAALVYMHFWCKSQLAIWEMQASYPLIVAAKLLLGAPHSTEFITSSSKKADISHQTCSTSTSELQFLRNLRPGKVVWLLIHEPIYSPPHMSNQFLFTVRIQLRQVLCFICHLVPKAERSKKNWQFFCFEVSSPQWPTRAIYPMWVRNNSSLMTILFRRRDFDIPQN